eukprot:gene1560-1900_t
MPQTRFVTKKALALNKKVVVVVNKIDRPAARADWVVDSTFELFMDLGATDEQCEFPVVYASGVNGIAVQRDVTPAPLQMLVTNIDYDEHKGRIAIGRVTSGTIRKAQQVNEVFVYDNFSRVPVEEVQAGDICAITGIQDIGVEPGETADSFIVSGRGTLHLGILIESMRREGYEFEIGPPKGTTRLTFKIATRGLLGLKNALLTATRGMGLLNTLFDSYRPRAGDIQMRENGSLVAFETGQVTAYALETAQERGQMFCKPGDQAGDLKINVCKAKALTNMRASQSEKKVALDEARIMGLDDALEYITDDEQVEVTPVSIRIRKDPSASTKRRGGR